MQRLPQTGLLLCASVLAGLLPFQALADDFEQPEWGAIEKTSIDGQFILHVESWDETNRINLPDGFPQVVLAETIDAAPSRTLEIAIDAESSDIALALPADWQGDASSFVRVTTSDGSKQFSNGLIALTALDAMVDGSRAELESDAANHRIGYWTLATDRVNWKYDATRWGKYEVLLTYSNASPDGSSMRLLVADETLEFQIDSTDSWYRYVTQSLGEVYLAEDGLVDLSLRCDELVGGAVMNVKSILLRPTCEGTPPVQDEEGNVTLHGRDAVVEGTMLRYEPAEHKLTLGYWIHATDGARWDFTITEPGEFEVEVLQGCGTDQGGSKMMIAVADQSIDFIVEDTGHFQNFKSRTIGTIKIDSAGDYLLRIQPEMIANRAACDVRQIRLIKR